MAQSSDCVRWNTLPGYCLTPGPPGSFDAGGVSARCVVQRGGGGAPGSAAGFLMYYEAIDEARRHSIGLATSSDGFTWDKGVSGMPVFEPAEAEGAWDGRAVARPWVVPMEDGSAR
eukprot:scaffold22783_cov51-Isochrysis_galbana.AAC.1